MGIPSEARIGTIGGTPRGILFGTPEGIPDETSSGISIGSLRGILFETPERIRYARLFLLPKLCK